MKQSINGILLTWGSKSDRFSLTYVPK